MPELPEVETVVRVLAPHLEGRRVRRLVLDDALLCVDRPERIAGRSVSRVHRVGKQIVLDLPAEDPLHLCVHLRMTGWLTWLPATPRPNHSHLRAWVDFDEGLLLFHDVRRFGRILLLDSLDAIRPAGLEPLGSSCTRRTLGLLLAGNRQEIKPWLLRQDKLVGLGNIYASEICHAAGIHPRRPAGELDEREVRLLHLWMRRILRHAIECGGTTISDFQDAEGRPGGFRKELAVYGRGGEVCRRCHGEIVREVQQGRSTFFCGACQH